MHNDYDDIIDKLGTPTWWDQNGCPRYCEFEPDRCGVYASAIAFLEIRCQGCEKIFHVAAEREQRNITRPNPGQDQNCLGDFDYGDPPFHVLDNGNGCGGSTMTSNAVRVQQFWLRDNETDYVWERRPQYEFVCPATEETEDGI